MNATTILMNIYGIPQSRRADALEVLENGDPKHLELSLMMLGQQEGDEDYDPGLETWMKTHLPEMVRVQSGNNA